MQRNILVLCPTDREHRDLPRLAKQLDVNVIWDDFAGDYFDTFEPEPELDVVALIDEKIKKYCQVPLAGITSAVGYPGMSVVGVMTSRLGLSGPRTEAVMLCEHKYYSRVKQQELVPEATPKFWLIDPRNPAKGLAEIKDFPVFLKPVKSWMSMNAYRIHTATELKQRVKDSLLPGKILRPFNDMIAAYTGWKQDASCLLVEELLEGHQVSLEGYVFNKKVHVMGVVDAVMFPGTFSFKRFQYPSKLPQAIQDRMIDIAERFIGGIEYGDALFNMEMIYDPKRDAVFIIEVNPKIASQFPDFFEKVDGYSSYTVLMESALGQEPGFKRGRGKFNLAASCVLRVFEDQYVKRVPTPENVRQVVEKYPDAIVQIIASEGKKLSEQAQDTASFRYGLVNIGASSESDLEARFEDCKNLLNFELRPVEESIKRR